MNGAVSLASNVASTATSPLINTGSFRSVSFRTNETKTLSVGLICEPGVVGSRPSPSRTLIVCKMPSILCRPKVACITNLACNGIHDSGSTKLATVALTIVPQSGRINTFEFAGKSAPDGPETTDPSTTKLIKSAGVWSFAA